MTYGPVFRTIGASWVPVDTRLKQTAAGLEPRATVLPMVFSAGGDGPAVFEGDDPAPASRTRTPADLGFPPLRP